MTREYPQFAGTRSVEWDGIDKSSFDVAIIATAHDCVDHNALPERVNLVIDTRGACGPHDNVVKA